MERKIPRIVKNSAKCKLCGDEIESLFTHDYKQCKCGEIFVDGGLEYIRRGARSFANMEDTSIVEDDECGSIKKALDIT